MKTNQPARAPDSPDATDATDAPGAQRLLPRCPDCNAAVGDVHAGGCDIERCPECGYQAIGCGCAPSALPRLKWTGLWPGEAECIEFGLFCRMVNGRWTECAATEPDAQPYLNRLAATARWDAAAGRFVRK